MIDVKQKESGKGDERENWFEWKERRGDYKGRGQRIDGKHWVKENKM